MDDGLGNLSPVPSAVWPWGASSTSLNLNPPPVSCKAKLTHPEENWIHSLGTVDVPKDREGEKS